MVIERIDYTMSIDLYIMPTSAPCRAVLLTAEAIGLTLNVKYVDLMAGENMTPEYAAMNPQKTVPFMVDGDYKLTESRAIMAYLVDRYGKNSRLYPKNPMARGLINQRMYFDLCVLFKYIKVYYFPVLFGQEESHDPVRFEKMKTAFDILEKFLDGQDYVAGRSLTIADLTIMASVTTAEVMGFETYKYKNISKWMDRVKNSAPGYRKGNGEGIEEMKRMVAKLQSSEN